MNSSKDGKSKDPDLRQGIKGEVMVDNHFVGLPPVGKDDELKIASPDVGVPTGQTTHE